MLNLILSETEKVLIKEALTEQQHYAGTSLSESARDKWLELYKLKNKLKTKTKGDIYYNVD